MIAFILWFFYKTYMNRKLIIMRGITIAAVISLLGTTVIAGITPREAFAPGGGRAPTAITGDNVYVAWWTNKTGNDEVNFRASTDGGATFGEKINLSNTTDAASTRTEIDSDADSVVVTWWESNQTSDVPVMRVSTDNGATFGPVLTLAANGTLGEEEVEED
jgi:hypothetical protein